MTGYLTPAQPAERIEIIEHSRFICNIAHIESEEQAREFITTIKKNHSQANHHCHAFIADERGMITRFSDDGEPQGTAGLPILNALKNSGMCMAVAVVTRYFGGIKLGTGGLARAYGGITAECIKQAKISQMLPALFYNVTADYEQYIKFLNKKNGLLFEITETNFSGRVTFTVAVKKGDAIGLNFDFKSFALDLTGGKCEIEKCSEKYYSFKV